MDFTDKLPMWKRIALHAAPQPDDFITWKFHLPLGWDPVPVTADKYRVSSQIDRSKVITGLVFNFIIATIVLACCLTAPVAIIAQTAARTQVGVPAIGGIVIMIALCIWGVIKSGMYVLYAIGSFRWMIQQRTTR